MERLNGAHVTPGKQLCRTSQIARLPFAERFSCHVNAFFFVVVGYLPCLLLFSGSATCILQIFQLLAFFRIGGVRQQSRTCATECPDGAPFKQALCPRNLSLTHLRVCPMHVVPAESILTSIKHILISMCCHAICAPRLHLINLRLPKTPSKQTSYRRAILFTLLLNL